MELVRMGAQRDGVDLLFPLVAKPSFDDVFGEDIALQQKCVIGFQRVERLLQRAGCRLDLFRRCGWQVIEVLVNGLTRIDAIAVGSLPL